MASKKIEQGERLRALIMDSSASDSKVRAAIKEYIKPDRDEAGNEVLAKPEEIQQAFALGRLARDRRPRALD